jgi:hypothetical protein
MSDVLTESFYYNMEELLLEGYDSKEEQSEYLILDKEVNYQNTLPEFQSSSTMSYPTAISNEILGLREDINLLKQTIESQKDSFHEELERCNKEIRTLKRKLDEEKDTESDSNASTPPRTIPRHEETPEEKRAKWRVSCICFIFSW